MAPHRSLLVLLVPLVALPLGACGSSSGGVPTATVCQKLRADAAAVAGDAPTSIAQARKALDDSASRVDADVRGAADGDLASAGHVLSGALRGLASQAAGGAVPSTAASAETQVSVAASKLDSTCPQSSGPAG